ncbi:MAG: type II secretion system F family protein [Nocardioidaceae bacterium]
MTPATVAAMVFCGVFILVPESGASLRRVRDPTAPAPSRRDALPASWVRYAAAALAVYVVAGLVGGGGRLGVVAAASAAAVAVIRRVLGLWQLRRARRVRQRRVIMLCDALSAELRGGLPAVSAVRRSCGAEPELAPVLGAAELGGDVAGAMRTCAGLPGAEGMQAVAAAWEVAGSSGAALAAVLERLAQGLRSDDDARAEVQAALGPPRATAKMLAVLPLFGLGLGVSIGAHPVGFLLGTPWGLACLSGGVLLSLVGLWWVEQLARAAEV